MISGNKCNIFKYHTTKLKVFKLIINLILYFVLQHFTYNHKIRYLESIVL